MKCFHALCVVAGVSAMSFVHADGVSRGDPGTRVMRDVSYSDKAPCVGDLHLPASVTGATPMVLVIHGGGWTAMDRTGVAGIAQFLADDLGYVVYNIDYRLAGRANPWTGDLNELWLQATELYQSLVDIDWMRFEPSK